jgi:hypothetical protein
VFRNSKNALLLLLSLSFFHNCMYAYIKTT